MTYPEADCANDDFSIEPPLPPEWLVRAEMRDLAHLAPTDPVRVRRLRALWGLPGANPEEGER
jgi:hypothetical protein